MNIIQCCDGAIMHLNLISLHPRYFTSCHPIGIGIWVLESGSSPPGPKHLDTTKNLENFGSVPVQVPSDPGWF